MNLESFVTSIVEDVRSGANLDEKVDTFINTSDYATHTEVLEAYGDVNLSEPKPDLTAGWPAIRAQLAYNALYQETSKRLRGHS